MKANCLTTRSLRPLMILFLTASAVTTTSAATQVREVRRHGLRLRVALESQLGERPAARMQIRLVNERPAPVVLASDTPNHGLSFRLVDAQGGFLVDDLPWDREVGPSILGPNQVLEWNVDLSTRPLYRIFPGPEGESYPVDGVFDSQLREESHLDLRVSFFYRKAVLEPQPIRLVLDQYWLTRARRFQELHRATEVAAAEARVHDDLASRPLARVAVYDPDRPSSDEDAFVPGMVLVTFAPHVGYQEAEELVERLGFQVAAANLFERMHILSITVPRDGEQDALETFRSLRCVASASLNHVARIMM